MNSKEQILAAARQCFAKKEVFLDEAKTVSVSVRELSRPEREALNARLFLTDEATGKPLTFNAEGKPDPKGEDWHFREGAPLIEEWLAATMSPAFTVEELTGPDWPASLKRSLYNEAQAVNGVSVKSAAGN